MPSKFDTIKNLILRKKIYFIGAGVLTMTTIIVAVVATQISHNKEEAVVEEEKNKKGKEGETMEVYNNSELFSNYYSTKTKNYVNFISSLEKDNLIAYHYNFQNNSEKSFGNKYQYLYDKDT